MEATNTQEQVDKTPPAIIDKWFDDMLQGRWESDEAEDCEDCKVQIGG